jgi:uncharacterized membrane protein
MTLLPRWWRANFLVVELVIAIVLTTAFALWYSRSGGELIVADVMRGNRAAIYGTLASILGSLLGFAITAISIILGFIPQERMAVLRESAHYNDLWQTFMAAIRALALATVATLLGLVLDRDTSPIAWLDHLCVFSILLSLFRVFRCVWILEKVIRLMTLPSKARPGAGA